MGDRYDFQRVSSGEIIIEGAYGEEYAYKSQGGYETEDGHFYKLDGNKAVYCGTTSPKGPRD